VPFRLAQQGFPNRAKIQFTTAASHPYLIYRACLATDTPSNTVYMQHALVAALSRDLGISEAELLADLPRPRGPSAHLYDPDEHKLDRYGPKRHGIAVDKAHLVRIGPANTDEEVR
jgi:hypothetical protein